MQPTRTRDLVWYESGQSGYTGRLLALSRKIDGLFMKWAREWRAEEYAFPTFIAASALAKIDYLESFPHLATFPTTLRADEANLAAFVARQREKQDAKDAEGAVSLTETSEVKDLLTPAACYHFYVRLQDQALPKTTYLTTRATCFRRETHYVPLERQSGFSMREIVCLGAENVVRDFLGAMQAKLETFFREIELPVRVAAATDPFFRPLQNPKFFAQKLEPMKSEFMFDDRLAIASLNFHRSYFGEAFAIRHEGEAAFSGCAAFGIERWMSAICATYGEDIGSWPSVFRVEE